VKILQIISTLDRAAGGPVEGAIQQGRELTAMGHAVHVVSLDSPDIQIDDRITRNTMFLIGSRRFKYGFSSRLEPWLRANGPRYDIFIVHGIWQYHGYCARKVANALGIPYVVFTHGMLDPWFRHQYPLKHFKKWLYWPWGEYRVLRDAAFVLFTTEEELNLARDSFWLYKVREELVGYGIRPRNIPPPKARDTFLLKHPNLRDKRLVLYLSRIHQKKGCDLLIRAFAGVADKDPRLHLVMAGPDATGWQARLTREAEALGVGSRVTFVGMVQGDMKWGAYDAAEIFILPSHQENFGIVVAEALASELPVLTTDKVNIWREILSAGAGLIDSDTQAGTDRLLNRWLEMSELKQQQMRERALACFRSNFDIHQVLKKLHTALEQAIIKPKGQFTYARSTPWFLPGRGR
jgi:glycosyltransferase involved in cell wall biosynthesis